MADLVLTVGLVVKANLAALLLHDLAGLVGQGDKSAFDEFEIGFSHCSFMVTGNNRKMKEG